MPDPAPLFWVRVFVLLAYTLTLGCVYHATRVGVLEYQKSKELGYPRPVQVSAAVSWILFLSVFAIALWAIESWGHFRTPFYVYDAGFPDLIPRIPFHDLLPSMIPTYQCVPGSESPGCCAQTVRGIMDAGKPESTMIPLSVVLFEGSLVYASLWIAMLMGAGFRLAPLLAGLIMVNVDALVDPVVALGHSCSGMTRSVEEPALGQPGLGLWHWYHPETGLALDGMADWFGVPLFNYASWFAAPVVLSSFVMIVQYWRERRWPLIRRRKVREKSPTGWDASVVFLLCLIAGALYLAVQIAPTSSRGELFQWGALGLALALTVAWLIVRVRRGDLAKCDPVEPVDPSLTRPIYFLLLLGVSAMLLEAVFLNLPGLSVVALGSLLIGSLLTWWPYPGQICRFCQRMIEADRIVRIRYLGLAFLLVLLGGFATGLQSIDEGVYVVNLRGWEVGALLGIGLCFHVWSVVLNDLIDRKIDIHDEKRRHEPLVEGRIAPARALALAAMCIPGMILLAFLLRAPLEAFGILAAAVLLMAGYNLWGKRFVFPPLFDLVHASAWGCLALFAAKAVEPVAGSTEQGRPLLVWSVAIWGGGYILLIKTISGRLRDLANYRACGLKTTVILLGAKVDRNTGQAISNARIAALAFAVHLAMFVLPTLVLFSDLELGEGGRNTVMLALYGLGAISLLVLWFIVKPHQPSRDRWISWHQVILLLPPPFAFFPFLDPAAMYLLITACFAPLLVRPVIVRRVLQVTHPAIAAEAVAPPSADNAFSSR